jgi:hypothetical protein
MPPAPKQVGGAVLLSADVKMLPVYSDWYGAGDW